MYLRPGGDNIRGGQIFCQKLSCYLVDILDLLHHGGPWEGRGKGAGQGQGGGGWGETRAEDTQWQAESQEEWISDLSPSENETG